MAPDFSDAQSTGEFPVGVTEYSIDDTLNAGSDSRTVIPIFLPASDLIDWTQVQTETLLISSASYKSGNLILTGSGLSSVRNVVYIFSDMFFKEVTAVSIDGKTISVPVSDIPAGKHSILVETPENLSDIVELDIGGADSSVLPVPGADPRREGWLQRFIDGTASLINKTADWVLRVFFGEQIGSELSSISYNSVQGAVSALIRYSSPNVDISRLSISALTQAQKDSLQKSLTSLSGKKFIIFKGETLLLADSEIRITAKDDVISLEIVQKGKERGSINLANLTHLNRLEPLNPSDPWYDYLYDYLENLAKIKPGADFGDDPAVLSQVKSYLDNRFVDIGGADRNFDISGLGNVIKVNPKKTNNLTGADGYVSMSFENDPLRYDKSVITAFFMSLKDEIVNTDADFFYIAGDNFLELLSVYDLNNVIKPTRAAIKMPGGNAAQTQLLAAAAAQSLDDPYEDCYNTQTQPSGSVIPCNNQIDWVDSNVGPIAGFEVPGLFETFKGPERLGYTFNKIERKAISGSKGDGFGFLKALVQSKGQIFLMDFGHADEGDGFYRPFGCITPPAKKQDFVNRLNTELGYLFNKELTESDVVVGRFFPRIVACGVSQVTWGIRLIDTKINPKAIQAGYMCYACTKKGKINAKAHYLTLAQQKSGPSQKGDMQLFSRYLLGLGPDTKYYNIYPPLLDRSHNADVANLLDDGPPCLSDPSSCIPSGSGAFRWVPATPGSWSPLANMPGRVGSVLVQVPNVSQAIDSAHLFPYVESLSMSDGGTDSRINFSDNIIPDKSPVLDFKVKDKSVISSGLSRVKGSDREFSFKLFPEIEIVRKETYDAYILDGGDAKADLLKGLLTLNGAFAAANGIEMVGNPLAFHTAEDTRGRPSYGVANFLYNKYFWDYNARAQEGTDIHSFKANIPVKLHPYVESVTVDGGQAVTISFSMGAPGALFPVNLPKETDASGLVDIDTSACGSKVFTENGSPKMQNSRSLFFMLDRSKDGLNLYPGNRGHLPDDWQGTAVKISVKGGSLVSPWNKFPLLGNADSKSKWIGDMDGNEIPDWKEGNSDQFPQQQGDFEVWIPCTSQSASVSVPPAFILFFDTDGAPDWVTVDNDPALDPVITNLKTQFANPTTLRVSWTTDVPSTSLVEYGTKAQYESDRYPFQKSVRSDTYVTEHVLEIPNLDPYETYYLMVRSNQNLAQESISSEIEISYSGEGILKLNVISSNIGRGVSIRLQPSGGVLFDPTGNDIVVKDANGNTVQVVTDAVPNAAGFLPFIFSPSAGAVGPYSVFVTNTSGQDVPVGAGSSNLSATAPVLFDSSGKEAGPSLVAGTMTIRASILNEGGLILRTFNGTLQYRSAAAPAAGWTDWIDFKVAGLIAGGRADITHTWEGGAGGWEFRLVADGRNVIAESNELDNYSQTSRVSILTREGAVAPPPLPASGKPNLVLKDPPFILGEQRGFGKLYAGTMTISATVENEGNGAAPPFQIRLLYSAGGVGWSDWVGLDSSSLLAPHGKRTVTYNWNSGAGEWYFKACEDLKDTCSPPSPLIEVVPR